MSAFWGDPFLSCIPDFTTGREYCQPAYQALLSPGAPAVERRALKMNIIWSDGAAEWKDIMNYGARDSWMMRAEGAPIDESRITFNLEAEAGDFITAGGTEL
ncbi:hypothetical protein EVAR_103215_1 [Eumeta japonica]|uniref:Uncharacterized protein n=1 Tax=Eumeta variegata TaxID=151549 RepID=A0A4C1ZZS3_EUMVA|nr:hypothetical protein EVAR_103215_1 [Eumeta japonica]